MVATLAESEVLPPAKRGPGRPTLYNEQRHEAIVSEIRRGLAPSRAGAIVGIGADAVREWRERFPEFDEDVTRAEAQYVSHLTEQMGRCETKWKTPDPKALELLSRRFVEFRQHQETTSTSVNLTVGATVAPDQLAKLQAMWALSLEEGK